MYVVCMSAQSLLNEVTLDLYIFGMMVHFRPSRSSSYIWVIGESSGSQKEIPFLAID